MKSSWQTYISAVGKDPQNFERIDHALSVTWLTRDSLTHSHVMRLTARTVLRVSWREAQCADAAQPCLRLTDKLTTIEHHRL